MSDLKALKQSPEHRQTPPKWLPVSLLALTTVALTIPAALLWRQKRALGLSKHLSPTAPPLRRNVKGSVQRKGHNTLAENATVPNLPKIDTLVSSPPPPRRATRRVVEASSSRTAASSSSSSVPHSDGSASTYLKPSDNTVSSFLDGPVYTLGAFGLATVLVGVGASLGVLGVQRSMGVNNVEEFAARMRQILLERIPWLSRRIHHSTKATELQYTSDTDEQSECIPHSSEEWTWDAAEERLRVAVERGGVSTWAESAVREMEEEARIERSKRGL